MTDLANATEGELRSFDVPWPKTTAELLAIVELLAARKHDYGTCVYAVSIAATAAFNYMYHTLGITGFQASCADMDILRRTRGMRHGFKIIDFGKLLYPQYLKDFTVTADDLLAHPGTRKDIREAARKLLDGAVGMAHSDVVAHWRWLSGLRVLDGEVQP